MKKIIFFLTTAIAMTVFSSFKVAPPATVIDTHLDLCGPFGGFNPCNGESIVVEGCYSVDLHAVLNANRANVSQHIQGHLEGTGDLGNEYNVNYNINVTQNVSVNNGQIVLHQEGTLDFISKGGAPNYKESVLFHITLNADGTATATITKVGATCNG